MGRHEGEFAGLDEAWDELDIDEGVMWHGAHGGEAARHWGALDIGGLDYAGDPILSGNEHMGDFDDCDWL